MKFNRTVSDVYKREGGCVIVREENNTQRTEVAGDQSLYGFNVSAAFSVIFNHITENAADTSIKRANNTSIKINNTK